MVCSNSSYSSKRPLGTSRLASKPPLPSTGPGCCIWMRNVDIVGIEIPDLQRVAERAHDPNGAAEMLSMAPS